MSSLSPSLRPATTCAVIAAAVAGVSPSTATDAAAVPATLTGVSLLTLFGRGQTLLHVSRELLEVRPEAAVDVALGQDHHRLKSLGNAVLDVKLHERLGLCVLSRAAVVAELAERELASLRHAISHSDRTERHPVMSPLGESGTALVDGLDLMQLDLGCTLGGRSRDRTQRVRASQSDYRANLRLRNHFSLPLIAA
jgi:hypothetical protein